ncbi:alpha/beta hydrolase family protein [Micrococcus terreus]|uniref:alpha/beta hydrolase family protein n=1 Tax=Micrococcus terreus TaxID=574650 RepID=UPI0021A55C7C|nr:alpha/beta hydrolase family protein [Micrococcus terreus]MCT2089527.1 alpha/beta hydrolase family protein [Micrococcus terreus]
MPSGQSAGHSTPQGTEQRHPDWAARLRERAAETAIGLKDRLSPVVGVAADAVMVSVNGAVGGVIGAAHAVAEHLPGAPSSPHVEQVSRRDIWDRQERAATLARLREDMDHREELGPRQKSALDGIVHALRRDSMDRSYPERILLAYDLGTATRPPTAVVAVGNPDQASHVTWQVSGMGVFVHTAMWGTVREAAQLCVSQREAGAPSPCVVTWLGYAPPGPWGVLSGAAALQGGARLAQHLHGWFDAVGRGCLPQAHTAVESHSYGTLVAARGLQILNRGIPPRQVDALVVSGPVGLPRDLAEDPKAMGLPAEKVFFALSDTDWLSAIGFRLSGRKPWKHYTRLPVLADEALNLAGVVGHNTSRHLPEGGFLHRGHGYRDPGSASLYRIARATTGTAG